MKERAVCSLVERNQTKMKNFFLTWLMHRKKLRTKNDDLAFIMNDSNIWSALKFLNQRTKKPTPPGFELGIP